MENPISITLLNDFVFCPASIFFHKLVDGQNSMLFQSQYQINGLNSHKAIDNHLYSNKKSVLQSYSVYCEKYNLYGVIDIFDVDTGILTERKKKIVKVYDGYIFQIYGQYYALLEAGYKPRELRFYSVDDNKVFNVKKPEDDKEMLKKFESTIDDIENFDILNFSQSNKEKCQKCIYEPMCSYSLKKNDYSS